MKKSKTALVFMCIILLIALVGCGSQAAGNSAEKNETQTADLNGTPADDNQKSESQSADQTAKGSENKAPGAGGQDNNGQPDLWGQVKSVSGNTIILALAAMPEKGAAPPSGSPAGERPTEKPPEQPGERPAGQGPSLELTGKTQTIAIPTGIKIISGARDDTAEVALSTIKAGDILQVWFKDGESGDIVEMVRLMKTP